MFDVCNGFTVDGLVARVTDGWQIHVGSSFLSFNTLEFCVMEVGSVIEISLLGWVFVLSLQSAEVVLTEFSGVGGSEAVDWCGLRAFLVFSIDGAGSCLCKGFSVEVFRFDLRHVTCISGNVLGLDVIVGTTEPVGSVL